ncbi:MAG: LamG-like jellyroll fold domain-containing protein, partial [Candidatus Ornithomonoglobus sp.]
NGNALLTGQKNITISFKVKPTTTATSWWFFAAPNANAQTYQQEQYLGAMTNGGTLTVERYNNSGSRSTAATGAYTENAWNDVMISVADDSTTVYINGTETSTTASTVNIADMLGTASVAYIGLANWGENGEFASGYLDDFVIKTGAAVNPLGSLDLGDTSAITENIILPEDSGITWVSSDESVVTASGVITRADETKSAYLTATTVSDGITYSKDYVITVVGKAAAADTFTVYAENGSIKFTSGYGASTPYDMYVALHDDSGKLISVKKNQADGSFDGLENGSYKVSCYIWDNISAKHAAVTKTVKVAEEQEMSAYLFAHFVGTESSEDCEQIYFSVSQDGTAWKTLNGGLPMLRSTVGEKGVRDPYILRGEDGKFFVIATDLSIYNRRDDSNRWGTCQTAGSKSIVIWESDDLVNWSAANLVNVAVDNAGCTWAPEAVYDAEKDAYMVFWASKVSDDGYSTQRIYRSYTKDFKVFTEPEIYIDGGNVSNIDTTIVSDKGVYYRFTKNESKSSITMMKAVSLDGPWTDVETYTINGVAGNTVTGYEGPAIYRLNGTDSWCLLLDYYSKSQGYKPFTTTDISNGVLTSAADFSFDATYRHGTVMPITAEEYNKLIEAYPLAN